jgi:hypothetical protein
MSVCPDCNVAVKGQSFVSHPRPGSYAEGVNTKVAVTVRSLLATTRDIHTFTHTPNEHISTQVQGVALSGL